MIVSSSIGGSVRSSGGGATAARDLSAGEKAGTDNSKSTNSSGNLSGSTASGLARPSGPKRDNSDAGGNRIDRSGDGLNAKGGRSDSSGRGEAKSGPAAGQISSGSGNNSINKSDSLSAAKGGLSESSGPGCAKSGSGNSSMDRSGGGGLNAKGELSDASGIAGALKSGSAATGLLSSSCGGGYGGGGPSSVNASGQKRKRDSPPPPSEARDKGNGSGNYLIERLSDTSWKEQEYNRY
jgi:hypothetical protein